VNSQEFAVKEPARKKKKWGILGYDPALCIMCEKCVHTCNEVIGSAALYVKPGGYKSIIDMKFSRCEQCGDCISVCPVGALVSNEFKYTANAWESKKIPATCAHCSSGCALYYNVKNSEISDPYNQKITRVTNDFDFNYLCGAGRFGFEFENKGNGKNPQELEKVVNAIKNSDAIKFNSYITNEEVKILQTLKEKIGIKLINEDASNYKNFLENYKKASGNSIYTADSKDIEASDAIIMIGTRITRDNPGIKFATNIATKKQRAEFVYMHPLDDISLQNKYTQFIKYEAGSEEGVVALLASYLIKNIPEAQKKYFEDLDIGYLSGETSVGEEELELVVKKLARRKNKTLIVGQDLYGHENGSNIAKLIGLIDKYTDFNVILVPSSTNTLGVSLICELDSISSENLKVVGYNEIGDFVISSNGDGDFQVPALNQQEGTFVDLNKKVVNTNVAITFDGYCLNDIVNEFLEKKVKNSIDYSSQLPVKNGFKAISFDELKNGYNKYGEDLRGYFLENTLLEESELVLDEVTDINTYNGTVIYRCEPLHQFNKSTAKSLQLQSNDSLRGSTSFATAAKIKDGDTVNIVYNNNITTKKFKIDTTIKGTIALYPTYSDGLNSDLVASGYRFKQVQIQKVDR
jgi:NADH-quinone oxidoreductase subunit G